MAGRAALRPKGAAAPTLLRPLDVGRLLHQGAGRVPDPIEFVLSDRYLGKRVLYPRQATMLKVIFLRTDMMTDYDLEVIGEWEETFRQTGYDGISPGIMDRIRINKEAGRKWFREVLAVIGRRGGKGHLGALAGSYITWDYMNLPGGPQAYYGIDPEKRLTALVFGSKKEQAVANQWRDLASTILGGRCFQPYISRDQTERLTIYTPADLLKLQQQELSGLTSERDQASIEIVPSASTATAGRGPAAFMNYFDEQGHMVKTGAGVDAATLYSSATPALDQFGVDGFIFSGSSPWQKQGQLFDSAQNAIEMDDDEPAYPAMLLIQLPSWGPYEDWHLASSLALAPPTKTYIDVKVDGLVKVQEQEIARTFPSIRFPVQQYDNDMKKLERANPETFAVERKSRWAASLNAYLNEAKVEAAMKPWRGNNRMSTGAPLTRFVAMHGDPAKINDNFGFVVGHVEEPDEDSEGVPHVVFDIVKAWRASDFDEDEDGLRLIDYDQIQHQIERFITMYRPDVVSFDQFGSVHMIGNLKKFVRKKRFPKRINVYERTATRSSNWIEAETFKAALNMNLIHIPTHDADGNYSDDSELLGLELRFLEDKGGRVDHPTSGPVQTKDVADAAMAVTYHLIGDQMTAYLSGALSEATRNLGATMQANPMPKGQTDPIEAMRAATLGGRSPGAGYSPARGRRR